MSFHVCKAAFPDCPRPDLCMGEICIAPEICHDPAVRANPAEWKRRLDQAWTEALAEMEQGDEVKAATGGEVR